MLFRSEIAPVLTNDSHKTTYSTSNIPGPGDEHSQEYTDAKAAYDAVDLDTASKADLTALEKVITDALADPSVLKDGEEAEMNTWLQNIKDAPHYNDEDPGPGPGETDVSVNITYVLAITPNGGHLDKKATDGVLTLTKAELLTVIPAAILKHYTIESVTCDGNTVAPDADGNWTFTNVGSTLDLTVTWSGNFQGGGDSSGDGTVGGDGDTNVDWGRVSASARAAVEPGRDEGVLTVKVGKNQEINWDPEKTIFSEGTGYVESSIIRTPLDADFDLITMTVWRTTGLKNYVIYIALQSNQVEYNVTISGEDILTYSTEGTATVASGESVTLKFNRTDGATTLAATEAWDITPKETTAAEIGTPEPVSDGDTSGYKFQITVANVTADLDITIGVIAKPVTVTVTSDTVEQINTEKYQLSVGDGKTSSIPVADIAVKSELSEYYELPAINGTNYGVTVNGTSKTFDTDFFVLESNGVTTVWLKNEPTDGAVTGDIVITVEATRKSDAPLADVTFGGDAGSHLSYTGNGLVLNSTVKEIEITPAPGYDVPPVEGYRNNIKVYMVPAAGAAAVEVSAWTYEVGKIIFDGEGIVVTGDIRIDVTSTTALESRYISLSGSDVTINKVNGVATTAENNTQYPADEKTLLEGLTVELKPADGKSISSDITIHLGSGSTARPLTSPDSWEAETDSNTGNVTITFHGEGNLTGDITIRVSAYAALKEMTLDFDAFGYPLIDAPGDVTLKPATVMWLATDFDPTEYLKVLSSSTVIGGTAPISGATYWEDFATATGTSNWLSTKYAGKWVTAFVKDEGTNALIGYATEKCDSIKPLVATVAQVGNDFLSDFWYSEWRTGNDQKVLANVSCMEGWLSDVRVTGQTGTKLILEGTIYAFDKSELNDDSVALPMFSKDDQNLSDKFAIIGLAAIDGDGAPVSWEPKASEVGFLDDSSGDFTITTNGGLMLAINATASDGSLTQETVSGVKAMFMNRRGEMQVLTSGFELDLTGVTVENGVIPTNSSITEILASNAVSPAPRPVA